jgi:hypothetical protein
MQSIVQHCAGGIIDKHSQTEHLLVFSSVNRLRVAQTANQTLVSVTRVTVATRLYSKVRTRDDLNATARATIAGPGNGLYRRLQHHE